MLLGLGLHLRIRWRVCSASWITDRFVAGSGREKEERKRGEVNGPGERE